MIKSAEWSYVTSVFKAETREGRMRIITAQSSRSSSTACRAPWRPSLFFSSLSKPLDCARVCDFRRTTPSGRTSLRGKWVRTGGCWHGSRVVALGYLLFWRENYYSQGSLSHLKLQATDCGSKVSLPALALFPVSLLLWWSAEVTAGLSFSCFFNLDGGPLLPYSSVWVWDTRKERLTDRQERREGGRCFCLSVSTCVLSLDTVTSFGVLFYFIFSLFYYLFFSCVGVGMDWTLIYMGRGWWTMLMFPSHDKLHCHCPCQCLWTL